MLNHYFKYPRVLQRMRLGPLGGKIDSIATDLDRAGYARMSTRLYLSLIASFSRFAQQAGCTGVRMIDRALIEKFIRRRSLSTAMASSARSALGHVLRHLGLGNEDRELQTASEQRNSALFAGLDAYLRDIRGLEAKSREEILRAARRTISWYHQIKRNQPLARLSAKDVLAYAGHAARQCASDRTRSSAMSHLRSLLRYLHWAAICSTDLSRYVPRVPIWPLASIPDHLPWADIRRLIGSIDSSDPAGRRDRALVLLAATTGMRNSELRRLEVGDIRWRDAEVRLRQTKSRRERIVPLVTEAGRALSDYLLHGRPHTQEPRVFLSHRPPVRPLTLSSTVSAIIRRRLKRLGICPDRAGTHLLRHSLATQMVRRERPVKEVADLLGHQHVDTTAIYIKVALPQLMTVALPFPGGEE